MARERALPQATNDALDDARPYPTLRYAKVGRPLELHFPAAYTRRDIAHGLDAVPDGYHVLMTTANLIADHSTPWTRDVVALQTDMVDARAIVVFFSLLENEVQRA